MQFSDDLPLMRGLPRSSLPTSEPMILASSSPRRAQLLEAAGYEFQIDPASSTAECGICSGEAGHTFAAKNAFLKAADVAKRYKSGLIIGADTVAWCDGQILGKPRDEEHAESTLRMLSGRKHDVLTGICVRSVELDRCVLEIATTTLKMQPLSEQMLREYLDSMLWEGKAGAFGYQDGNDWLVVEQGSESNVVGLPMERLAEILSGFDTLSKNISSYGPDPPLGA